MRVIYLSEAPHRSFLIRCADRPVPVIWFELVLAHMPSHTPFQTEMHSKNPGIKEIHVLCIQVWV